MTLLFCRRQRIVFPLITRIVHYDVAYLNMLTFLKLLRSSGTTQTVSLPHSVEKLNCNQVPSLNDEVPSGCRM